MLPYPHRATHPEKGLVNVKRKALVLGGGGTVGIAWEAGIAAGLLESGVNLSDADLLIGTSAGSVVATLLASGVDPRQFLALQVAAGGAPPTAITQTDTATLQAIHAKWTTADELNADLRQEIGSMALAARTITETEWIANFVQNLGGEVVWPERPLLVTAVDAFTGAFVTWAKGAGVPLHLAMAASCTVPGLFPPVTIGDSRYVDGGVRSATNADLAAGYETVVIVAPLATPAHPLGHRLVGREIAELQARGTATELLLPDHEAMAAFGGNIMDASRIGPAAEAGVRQGRAFAGQLAELWAG
jgi:NTE family protein